MVQPYLRVTPVLDYTLSLKFWQEALPFQLLFILRVVDVDEGEVFREEGVDLGAGGGDAGGNELGDDSRRQHDEGDSHGRAEGGDEFLGVDDAGFGVVGEEDDRRKRYSNRERPLEEIWLRGNGAIAFKIINRELEVGLRAKVVTTEVRDEIIDADFVVSFKNDFHMMLASGFAKFFWLDVR